MDIKNNVQLIGHLGGDPELRVSEKGKELCTFSIATSYKKKNEGGASVQKTEWHNIVAFSGAAVLAGTYLKKGSHIALNGSLRTRNYEDRNGVVKYVTEVVLDRLEFLGKKDA